MGKKGGWFFAVKKAFNPEAKETKDQKSKSKKRWFAKNKDYDKNVKHSEHVDHLENADHTENYCLFSSKKDHVENDHVFSYKKDHMENDQEENSLMFSYKEDHVENDHVLPYKEDHVKKDHIFSYKEEPALVIPTPIAQPPPPPAPLPTLSAIKEKLSEGEDSQRTSISLKEDVELLEAEDSQSKRIYSVALATTMAAEAAVAAAKAAAEVVRLAGLAQFSGKSSEEAAAINIQTAFRGHMARRELGASRGLERLKSLVEGQSVKHQSTTALKCMQTVARVQAEIRARRMRMSKENQELQRQIQQKREKQRVASIGEDWDLSLQSKEEVDAKLKSRQEAAKRRERALAYSVAHQNMWKTSSKSQHPTFMDSSDPHWGWSWLERWMASRPWESQSTSDFNDRALLRNAARRASMTVVEMPLAYTLSDVHRESNTPPYPTGQKTPSTTTKKQSSTLRSEKKNNSWGGDEDSKSTCTVQHAEKINKRHSIAATARPSLRHDDNLASTTSVPSVKKHVMPARSTKPRSRPPSPSSSGLANNKTPTPDKGPSQSVSAVKKRLSYPASPAAQRRHSGPLKVGGSSRNIAVRAVKKIGNG